MCLVYNFLPFFFFCQGTPSAVEGISCSINDQERDWSPTIFNGMRRLWLLNVNNSSLDFPEGLQYLPNSLKCLLWPFWRWKSLPSTFMPRNIVELRMPYSELVQLWSGVQVCFNFNISLLQNKVCKNKHFKFQLSFHLFCNRILEI